MIDDDGYRPNVASVIINKDNKILWAKRVDEDNWQFPQGGIQKGETPEQAMYREVYEEVGLKKNSFEILGRSADWLKYDVPEKFIKTYWQGRYKGQKQIWFLLKFIGSDDLINLNLHDSPEFDDWKWENFWHPLQDVVDFKKEVYSAALNELWQFVEAKN
ncbi:RNA pyrophosphohydrolase [Methylophilales bacterium MBRSG12]|uniref:RNA pyrophosphohydrolase n=1 Tax=Methylophilales bacterium MBRS-H7 TaxID=1623450 RepID=A0A0H4J126_9PROT|nr:RNA pyrophosphohydrolase [Methylophilales bacterium MBRSF5]AKO65478.1 RNA pyrophosphohydrolase [Methylophilales bacterium MBRS-H7]AKO66798.1 RNA pyrophosphohydrolase [Methylophilales bacterium MBRSG12]